MTDRTEELQREIEATQKIYDKHNYEYCDRDNKNRDGDCVWDEIWICMTGYNAGLELTELKAELKGRQEMRDEIRGYLEGRWSLLSDNFFKDFDEEFGVKK